MTSAREIEGDDIFSALSAVCPSVCLQDLDESPSGILVDLELGFPPMTTFLFFSPNDLVFCVRDLLLLSGVLCLTECLLVYISLRGHCIELQHHNC